MGGTKRDGGGLKLSPRSWFWFLIAIVVAVAVADLFVAALDSGWTPPWSWASVADADKRIPGSVVVTVRVNRQTISVAYDLRLPKDHQLVRAVETDDPLAGTLDEYVGAISVNGQRLAFKPPTVNVRADRPDVTVMLRSAPMRLQTARSVVAVRPWPDSVCCLPPARVVVNTSASQVSSTLIPTEQTKSRTVYTNVAGGFDLQLTLTKFSPASSSNTRASVPSSPPDPDAMKYWHSMVSGSSKVPRGGLDLTLQIKRQTLTATYVLDIPTSAADQVAHEDLLQILRDHDEARDPQSLARFLGIITVDGRILRFQPPVITALAGASVARVSMTSDPIALNQQQPWIRVAPSPRRDCCLPPTRVVVQTDASLVKSASQLMATQSSKSTIFQNVTGTTGIDIVLILTPFDGKRAASRPNSALVKRLANTDLPGLGWVLYWCAVLAPAVLFLYWVRRGRLNERELVPGSLPLVRVLLALYLAILVASAVADLTARWPLAVAVAEGLHRLGLWDRARPYGYFGGPALLLIVTAVIWPGVIRELGREHSGQKPSQRRTRSAALVLLEAALAAVLAVAVTAAPWSPVAPLDLTATSTILLIAAGGAVLSVVPWILARVLGIRLRWMERVAAVVALILLLTTESLPRDSLVGRLTRAAVITGAGILILTAVGRFGLHAVRVISPPSWIQRLRDRYFRFARPHEGRRRGRWLLIVCCFGLGILILAVPTFGLVHNSSLSVSGWDLIGMSDRLTYILALCLGLVGLTNLRHVGGDRMSVLAPATRDLAVLFALPIFFDPWERVLYLPIPLLIGFLLLTRWLFVQAKEARWYENAPEGSAKAELLRKALDDGWRLRHNKAKEDPHDATGSTIELNWEERERIRLAQSAVLSLGPEDAPWERGKLFASYSLWLSLGWVLLYFIPREMSLWLQDDRYLTLSVIVAIVWNVVQWPAFGFLMGYFYPVIRGPNGLWKGLSVAIAIITPWLVLHIGLQLLDRHGSWQPFIVWALQVFITCVLTGFLAGEVRTLREAGYGFSALVNVHNFSVLAAWGSSVAVAVIGAVVTLLTTTIGQVVTSQFTGGPKPPQIP